MAQGLGTNSDQVEEFLAAKGLTDAQIAGIMGNWQVESNFSPTATGDGGLAYGLAQWHPDRRPPGGLSSNIQDQLNWFWTEAHTSEASSFNQFLANSATPTAAAASFDQYYERSDGSARTTREADANAWAKQFTGGGGFVGGLATGNAGEAASGAASDVANATGISSVLDFFKWFTSAANLLRVGYVVVGGVLVVVGFGKLFSGGAIGNAALSKAPGGAITKAAFA